METIAPPAQLTLLSTLNQTDSAEQKLNQTNKCKRKSRPQTVAIHFGPDYTAQSIPAKRPRLNSPSNTTSRFSTQSADLAAAPQASARHEAQQSKQSWDGLCLDVNSESRSTRPALPSESSAESVELQRSSLTCPVQSDLVCQQPNCQKNWKVRKHRLCEKHYKDMRFLKKNMGALLPAPDESSVVSLHELCREQDCQSRWAIKVHRLCRKHYNALQYEKKLMAFSGDESSLRVRKVSSSERFEVKMIAGMSGHVQGMRQLPKRTCAAMACDREVLALNLCDKHYKRFQRAKAADRNKERLP